MTTSEKIKKRNQEFDPSVLELSEEEWLIIEATALEREGYSFWRIVSALSQLDRARADLIVNEDDWEKAEAELVELSDHEHGHPGLRWRLIAELALVDRERAQKALRPDELQRRYEEIERTYRDGGPKHGNERLLVGIQNDYAIDPDGIAELVGRHPEVWDGAELELGRNRMQLPEAFFEIAATLTRINSERTLGLLRRDDWHLGLQGLTQFRHNLALPRDHSLDCSALINHVLELKTLEPLFKQKFEE